MPSLPKELLSSLSGLPGFDRAAFEQVHASGGQVTSIRFNQAKLTDRAFSLYNIQEKIPWSSQGYYLSNRPSFTSDPLFHAGVYYVQEASGMFLEQALKQAAGLSQPLKVLDLCAAPGGKSTLIQSLISKDSLLVSNEVIKSRVPVLEENLIKWGAANTIITNSDPREFARLENYFNVMVVDAPCSGSGLFRRDPEAIGEWSPEQVNICQQRQQRILADAWPALKQNGLLIYSTCSYSREENEDILDWMVENFRITNLRLHTEPEWNILETASPKHRVWSYRFFPDKLKGEGFFIACMQKQEGANFVCPKLRNKLQEKLNKNEEKVISQYIKGDNLLYYFKYNGLVHALEGGHAEDLALLQEALYLKRAGLALGRPNAGELIPEHDLALSTIVSPNIPFLSLNREEAIQYLRKEELKISDPRRALVLVRYEEQNLGWAKLLPNRINNYYPKNRRIRK